MSNPAVNSWRSDTVSWCPVFCLSRVLLGLQVSLYVSPRRCFSSEPFILFYRFCPGDSLLVSRGNRACQVPAERKDPRAHEDLRGSQVSMDSPGDWWVNSRSFLLLVLGEI